MTRVGPQITDVAGNTYVIRSAGYVVTNGQPETTISANVIELAYHAPVAGGPRQLHHEKCVGRLVHADQLHCSLHADHCSNIADDQSLFPGREREDLYAEWGGIQGERRQRHSVHWLCTLDVCEREKVIPSFSLLPHGPK